MLDDKPVLVLLPGIPGSGKLFSPFCKQLPNNIETIVLSYPSDKAMTYDELCKFLTNQLPETPFVLLGESFGGPLAILLSKQADHNLKGIILCSSFIKNPHPLLAKFLRPILKPRHFDKEIPNWIIKRYLLGKFSNAELISGIHAVIRGLEPQVLYCRLKEIADIDVTGTVAECELPILYLRASKDRLVYKSSMRIVKNHSDKVTTKTFEAPHMLLQTQPKLAADCIQAFVNGVAK